MTATDIISEDIIYPAYSAYTSPENAIRAARVQAARRFADMASTFPGSVVITEDIAGTTLFGRATARIAGIRVMLTRGTWVPICH